MSKRVKKETPEVVAKQIEAYRNNLMIGASKQDSRTLRRRTNA